MIFTLVPLGLLITLMAGCAGNPSEPPARDALFRALTLSAHAEESTDSTRTLQVRTVLTNTGDSRLHFQTFRDCAVRLRAYSTASRAGEPVWDEASGAACSYVAMQIDLDRGESRTLLRRIRVDQIPLPPGTYYLAAAVIVEDSVKVVDAGELVLHSTGF